MECAKAGLDWESELHQRAREVALMRELGLMNEAAAPAAVDDEGMDDNQDDKDDIRGGSAAREARGGAS